MIDLVAPSKIIGFGASEKAVVVEQDACSSAGAVAAQVFIDEFKLWMTLATNVMKYMKATNGADIADSVTGLGPDFLTTSAEFTKAFGSGASGGGGVGFGFSLLCKGEDVITFGGGGGGGFGTGVGFGGGGGIQGYSNSMGGGGGCNCADTCQCGGGPDANSIVNMVVLLLKAASKGCTSMKLCGGGGGGGSFTTPTCSYSANFGVAFAGDVELGTDGPHLYLNTTAPEATCAADPNNSGGITNAAAVACASTCNTAPDFNGCYCPCFKNQVSAAGLKWADTITCSS